MQTWHPHCTFVGIRLPPSDGRITGFPGGNMKSLNVLKISLRLCAVLLALRYQEIGSSIISYIILFLILLVQVSFSSKRNGSGWAQKVTDASLPSTAPSAHSGFSKGRPCLHVMIIIIQTSVYDFPWCGNGDGGKSCTGQLLIDFHNVFLVLTETLCRHSSLVPRSRIKAFVRKLRRCSSRPSPPLIRHGGSQTSKSKPRQCRAPGKICRVHGSYWT